MRLCADHHAFLGSARGRMRRRMCAAARGGGSRISWIRRTRIGGDSWKRRGAVVGDRERYEVDILDGTTVKRTIARTGPGDLHVRPADARFRRAAGGGRGARPSGGATWRRWNGAGRNPVRVLDGDTRSAAVACRGVAGAWANRSGGHRGQCAHRRLFRDAGHSPVVDDETAWCAAFAGAMLSGRGSAQPDLCGRDLISTGVIRSRRGVGSRGVLSRGANAALGHVGFVVGEADGGIMLLGGNQGNAVTVPVFARSRLLGCGWPGAGWTTRHAVPAEERDGDRSKPRWPTSWRWKAARARSRTIPAGRRTSASRSKLLPPTPAGRSRPASQAGAEAGPENHFSRRGPVDLS